MSPYSATERSPLPIISAGEWSGKPAPERMWQLEGWIPLQRATLLTGDGGSGKSLISQQIATCVALGRSFLGIPVRQANALYVTCEDDRGELHRRQEAICRSMDVEIEQLSGALFVLSRVGELDNSLLHYTNDGMMFSAFYDGLKDAVDRHFISFVVLDNIAHLFEGNENVRQHVAIFCNALEGLCRTAGITILFLGHPSKAGAQFSGSTAWENQVRSRIYLERPKGEDVAGDDNVRSLSRAKSNYAKGGSALALRWQDWAFVEHDPDNTDWRSDMESAGKVAADNELFLKLLAIRTDQRRPVSAHRQARNYAPKEFEEMPQAKGRTAPQLARAMERLFALGLIKDEEYRRADRHVSNRLVAVEGSAHQLRASRGAVGADQSAGRLSNPQGHASESPGSAGEMGADQLRASHGAAGAGGEPPIGGLPHPAPPPAGQRYDWLDPSDGLPPIGDTDDG